jgi:tetratricopeptide (TPR) repeat protein
MSDFSQSPSLAREEFKEELRKLEAGAKRRKGRVYSRTKVIDQANANYEGEKPLATSTVGDWFKKGSVTGDFEQLWSLVEVLRTWAEGAQPDTPKERGKRAEAKGYWKALWERTRSDAARPRTAQVEVTSHESPAWVGMPVGRWDPFELGVHQAITGKALPEYVERPHDHLLRAVLDPRIATSRLVVLRGEPSTGKSRAAYEAVGKVLRDWRVDYPETLEALARRLKAGIGRRTVLWLNEFVRYANGENVLANLAEVLRRKDSSVVVITTLWPNFWDFYTADHRGGPGTEDQYRMARDLLKPLRELTGKEPGEVEPCRGWVIDVPDYFTDKQLTEARLLHDPDLDTALEAADRAGDQGVLTRGSLTQYLAGVPELLKHYQGYGPEGHVRDPYGRAFITVAMDASRLGYRGPYPVEFLEAAVVGYLSRAERAVRDGRWRDGALAYATELLKNTIQALTPVPPEQDMGIARYDLADYLDQHGRQTRKATVSPNSLWVALTKGITDADDRTRVAWEAEKRGLYQIAAELAAPAARAGDWGALRALTVLLGKLGRDEDALIWLQHGAEQGEMEAMSDLGRRLLEAGRYEDAIRWLKPVVEAGYVGATPELVECYDRTDQPGEALSWVRRLVEWRGDLEDIAELARRLEDALQYEEALYWRRQAASSGQTEPLGHLASLLEHLGENEEALGLKCRVAARRADMGNPEAMRELVRLLRLAGKTCEADEWDARIEARNRRLQNSSMELREFVPDWPEGVAERWRDQQAALEAEYGPVTGTFTTMFPDGTMQVSVMRERWPEKIRKRAEAGNIEAMVSLAQFLGNTPEARGWLNRAIEKGYRPDRQRLIQLLECVGDNEAALVLREQIAQAENPVAAIQLADRLEELGREDKALAWTRHAASTDDPYAIYKLVDRLERFGYVEEAIQVLRRAVISGGRAVTELTELLIRQGLEEEAQSVQEYGLRPGGETAVAWSSPLP